MERKIGEIFEYEGKTLEVVETKSDTCYKCCFKEETGCCSKNKSKTGECEMLKRADRRPVIFVEVKNESKEQPQQSEETKELKIGETFVYKDRRLKAIEDVDDCACCVFFKGDCKRIHSIVGECDGRYRRDGKGVMFVNADEFDDLPIHEEKPHQKLNLCELLKDCPKGTKLWCENYGTVKFVGVNTESDYPIEVLIDNGQLRCFTKEGSRSKKFPLSYLYPSKDCRDWSKFSTPWCNNENKKNNTERKLGEDIDLTEILKNCPRGTKFYSYIFGEDTHFMGVSSHQGDARPIFIYGKYGEGQNFCLSRKGHAYADNYGECCIFPSKDQRDWSKFTAPWYKQEKKETKRFDPKTLNVFDRVLARVYLGVWFADFVSVPGDDELCDIPSLVGSSNFNEVIPYNEETKHLLGTTDDAPEYYQYVDDEWEDDD